MQRRSFLGGLSILFFSLKSFSFSGAGKASREISLVGGAEFLLPFSPEVGETIRFISHEEWPSNPPVVKSKKHPILGVQDSLSLDTKVDFTLVFEGEKRGWIIL